MRKCPFCGNECKDGAKICLGCGATLPVVTDDIFDLKDIQRVFAASQQPAAPRADGSYYDRNPGGYGASVGQEKPAAQVPVQPLTFTEDLAKQERARRAEAARRAAEKNVAAASAAQRRSPQRATPTRRNPSLYDDAPLRRTMAPARRKKAFRATPQLIGLLVVLALAFLALVFVMVMNATSDVDHFIDKTIVAVQKQDTATLNELMQGTAYPSDAEWKAFCDAFSTPGQQDALRAHFEKLATNRNAIGTYPAIGLVSSSKLIFWRDYHFSVRGVSVTVKTAATDVVLTLNGAKTPGGMAKDNEITFNDVFPGSYSYTVTGMGGGQPLSAGGEGLVVLDPGSPGVVELNVPAETIELNNCFPNSQLLVDGLARSETPNENGTVVLADVTAGSLVSAQYTDGIGIRYTASITVEGGVTSYTLGDYAQDISDSSLAQTAQTAAANNALGTDFNGMTALMEVYFASYLDCINTQSMMTAQYMTPEHAQRLGGRISSPSNAAYLYTFTTASVSGGSVFVDANTITLNAQFDYSYYTRGASNTDMTPNTTFQTVLLVYEGGVWSVSNMQSITEDQYIAGEYAPLG